MLEAIRNKILRYFIAGVAALLLVVIIFVAFVHIYPSAFSLPEGLTSSAFWTKVIANIPPGIWLILGLLLIPFVQLFPDGKNAGYYIMMLIGLITFFYAVMNSSCKRYFLSFAGIYSIVIGLAKLKYLGAESITSSSIISSAINWHVSVVLVLTIIDYYVFSPRCVTAVVGRN